MSGTGSRARGGQRAGLPLLRMPVIPWRWAELEGQRLFADRYPQTLKDQSRRCQAWLYVGEGYARCSRGHGKDPEFCQLHRTMFDGGWNP
jgi:hypothetical protein